MSYRNKGIVVRTFMKEEGTFGTLTVSVSQTNTDRRGIPIKENVDVTFKLFRSNMHLLEGVEAGDLVKVEAIITPERRKKEGDEWVTAFAQGLTPTKVEILEKAACQLVGGANTKPSNNGKPKARAGCGEF